MLGAVALAAMPLFLATPAQAADPGPREEIVSDLLCDLPAEDPEEEIGLDVLCDLLTGDADEDIAVANGGPVGPGLSELVAIAEGILRKYGITKSFADIQDLDAGILAIASGILNINGKEGIIAAPGRLLGNSPPKTSKLDAADQKLLPSDLYSPSGSDNATVMAERQPWSR
ncbi:hypothetical protein Cs7R123_62260 [Catellatospora sp. TT07R-123]|nr:hypothetical protein Cs7R123_62260 [Catellatospora sp. TT07R-123]